MPSFFDFLDQDVQDTAPAYVPSSPTGPQYQEFKRAAFLKRRSELTDAIRQRAIDYIDEVSPSGPSGYDPAPGSIKARLLNREIAPENIPGEVEKFVKPLL